MKEEKEETISPEVPEKQPLPCVDCGGTNLLFQAASSNGPYRLICKFCGKVSKPQQRKEWAIDKWNNLRNLKQ